MRVVLDTNVIISGLLRAGSPPDLLRQAWETRRLTLVGSEWQLEELRRVSRYPRLNSRFAPHEAGRLVGQIRRVAVMVDLASGVAVSLDPDDDPSSLQLSLVPRSISSLEIRATCWCSRA